MRREETSATHSALEAAASALAEAGAPAVNSALNRTAAEIAPQRNLFIAALHQPPQKFPRLFDDSVQRIVRNADETALLSVVN